MRPHDRLRWYTLPLVVLLLLSAAGLPGGPPRALASHTATPASANLAGNLQSEATANACGDWEPGCAGSKFGAQGNDVYLFQSAAIPAGDWEYKVALGSWAENYGANFQFDGPNIALKLTGARTVRFFYDHKTHYIADNVRNTIYTVPGDFNSEIGCSGDWQPECLRTFMSDVDGDGIYTAAVNITAPNSYNFKVATNESWNNPNYGEGGGQNNVPFNVTVPSRVTFSFNSANNTPSVTMVALPPSDPSPDNNVEWDGLRHDSRDTLYRSPGGAVPAGTPVKIRFRTFHDDVTSVKLRLYDLNAGGQNLVPMTPAATDVSCYQADLASKSCDFWEATVSSDAPNNFWYRFIVQDGTSSAYYADNTAALDGGLGATTKDPVDNSYALMVYDPAFKVPAWAQSAVIYQIFPDRFNNGDKRNDPRAGDHRYDDPVIVLPWNTLPEGYCRNYADGGTNCKPRFGVQSGGDLNKEQPRGRDYYGGDLKGVAQKLDYLQAMGVTAIYFNPIFAAGSNHRYDTRDYYAIDPYLGSLEDFRLLVKQAKERGIRVILDGVFNHMSSDSPNFDRYKYYQTVGACESASSPFRSWFVFRPPTGNEPAPCAPSTAGGRDTYYDGWFSFDSIPVIRKDNAAVQQFFINAPNSVSRYWLRQGAAGWRLDVMGDASFPNGYWEQFRQVVRETDPEALIIGELWQKDSTLLRYLRGDRADTTMNYRLRDAVLGLLTPGSFDSKGFGDSGRQIKPSEFAARIQSIREDYSSSSYYSLMNLLDSHDTERLLWTLTPGGETAAERERNADNVASGKQRQRLASLIQFTMPGAPTVYYGDEVGVTGDDDPDDRRTYPWPDTTKGDIRDLGMLQHYTTLASLRKATPSLTTGDLRVLLADDDAQTVAYGRAAKNQASVVVINRDSTPQPASIPVAGFLPDGTRLTIAYGVGNPTGATVTVAGGKLNLTLAPMSGVLLTTGAVDLTPPAAPAGLALGGERNGSVDLSWGSVAGAAGYNLYRSPVSGGGYVKVNQATLSATSFTDTGLRNAQNYYYVVRALDAAGNESAASNEIVAMPHLVIGWANLQWPPSITHEISAVNRTDTAYGQVWIDGETSQSGATETLRAQLGFGPQGSNPAGNPQWTWVDASFNKNDGNNDEFMASLLPEQTGTYSYLYRYTTTNGRDWLYADLNGPIAAGASPSRPGVLTVNPSADTASPSAPANLTVTSASPDGVELKWDPATDNVSVYGYEVLRSSTAGGPYTKLALVTEAKYTDKDVAQGASYSYVVRAVDTSFNRSGNSNEVTAKAELRTVTLQFTVTVPSGTDAIGRSVHIAGFLDRLDGGLPQWNPGGVVLTKVNATTWQITLTGREGTQIEYKYALGAWDYVEKDASCGEVANRQLTLTYGATGTQQVNDTVLNWRNSLNFGGPCGN